MISNDLRKRFFSFEGIDFSGKSTQIDLLRKYFEQKGEKVYVLREPGGTVISEKIREILLDKKHFNMNERAEMLLFSAARVQLTVEKIIPVLKEGHFVIADRFVDSTTAYQGYGRGLEQEIIGYVNHFATLGLLPCMTFYLRLSPQEAAKRRLKNNLQTDRLEETGNNFFENVFKGYEMISANNPDRVVIIDAAQVIDDIHRQIIKRIENL
ncbi:MAG: dTMP kinase [Calditrichae bacterium]|nr:dTMP kinase [Calditrichota bacterium]MCB9059674.1 dTMP kinase [Calditrichia bacterium]